MSFKYLPHPSSKVEVIPGAASPFFSCCGKPVCGAHDPDCQGYPDETELMDSESWERARRAL